LIRASSLSKSEEPWLVVLAASVFPLLAIMAPPVRASRAGSDFVSDVFFMLGRLELRCGLCRGALFIFTQLATQLAVADEQCSFASSRILRQLRPSFLALPDRAADMRRALDFYRTAFNAHVLRQSEVISELEIAGAIIGIHGGGEGQRTWTGLSFQVADVIEGAREVTAAGGQLLREPMSDAAGEPPHLAMCADPEGNEFMLTRKRH
jgi:lactoylglutathione lyase